MVRVFARRHGRARQRHRPRIQRTVERFTQTESGNVKKLQGIDPPEYRLRIGDWRVRFVLEGDTVRVLRVLNRKDAYR